MRWREDPTRAQRPRPDATIRPALPEDAELLPIIRAACLQQCLGSHYTRQHIAAWLEADARGNGETPGQIRVAEMQGAVAGYAAWDGDELLATFVVPAAQDMGVGTLLVETCMNAAANRGGHISRVRATLNAVEFYRALGFLPTEAGFHEAGDVRIPYQLMVRRDA